jgi:hypothetical protein
MKNDYYLFKLNLELMGISTYNRDDWVRELYKKYLKKDQNDYRETIRRSIEISCRHR